MRSSIIISLCHLYRFDFQKVHKISQRDKDIVYGYIKQIQTIFPWKENSYYIIAQLIQDLCLLFFHTLIDTKILTDNETDLFFDLLIKNNKTDILNFDWTLIYRKSRDGRLKDESFIKKKYENKQNILCLIESENNNVLGGYTYSGWKSGINVYNEDDKAFLFNIRSNVGYDPIISNIKPKRADKAMRTDVGYCLFFGCHWAICVDIQDERIYHQMSTLSDYEFSSNSHRLPLLGGVRSDTVKNIEIFQLK